jgi:hypothetical protein
MMPPKGEIQGMEELGKGLDLGSPNEKMFSVIKIEKGE